MIAGSSGGTASAERAAASPTFFLAGESKAIVPDALEGQYKRRVSSRRGDWSV